MASARRPGPPLSWISLIYMAAEGAIAITAPSPTDRSRC